MPESATLPEPVPEQSVLLEQREPVLLPVSAPRGASSELLIPPLPEQRALSPKRQEPQTELRTAVYHADRHVPTSTNPFAVPVGILW